MIAGTPCRATRVAADFLDFVAFCRCSTGVALHPLKILVSHLAPPCPGRCRTEIWVWKGVALHGGVAATVAGVALHCATKLTEEGAEARICTCLFWSCGGLVQVGANLEGFGALWNLKSVTVNIANAPKTHLIFKSVIPMGDLALFSRYTGTLVGKNLPETPVRNSKEFEVGNGKNYLHPKQIPSILYSVGNNVGQNLVSFLIQGACCSNPGVVWRPSLLPAEPKIRKTKKFQVQSPGIPFLTPGMGPIKMAISGHFSSSCRSSERRGELLNGPMPG